MLMVECGTYLCVKENGTKYYRDNDGSVFAVINGQKIPQGDSYKEKFEAGDQNAKKYYEDAKALKEFIEGISNDIVNWENIKERFQKDNGVTYAQKTILNNEPYEIEYDGTGKWIAGSTLCLNLKSIDKIPAFYNPKGARGEDTFFSTLLENTKVLRIPTYHFHDGFLKYAQIMRGRMPKNLRKINVDEESIEHRFLQASLGWIKYKPLLMYIKSKERYKKNIIEVKEKLKMSIPQIDELFYNADFDELIVALNEADKNVTKHYKEYIKTNEVWDKLKEYVIK